MNQIICAANENENEREMDGKTTEKNDIKKIKTLFTMTTEQHDKSLIELKFMYLWIRSFVE